MDPIVQAPFAVTVGTCDLDEARATCGEHLYPRSMRLIDPSARLAARFAFLHLDGLTVSDVRYGAAVAGECADLGSYHVNLVAAGHFAAQQGSRTINGDTNTAGVYRPVGHNFLHGASADCHLLSLSIDTDVLEEALASLLNAPVRGRPRLAEQMDVRRAPGRSCAELIRFLADEIHNPNSLIYQPLVAAPLQETLVMSLLFAVDHQYQDALRQSAPRCPSHRVNRAIDAIRDEPQRPYTVAALAKIAGVGLGCLQQEFHRQVGVPPMAYLREVRLARAHNELVDADPDQTSVADVARRWGFARPGWFADRYRRLYGLDPAETLRRGKHHHR
ncbi:AraC family transcriptional regulator [Actinoplanes sp. NPDC051633]|uniref:AraC family transcriptional regulator n=1 Tax=Actinoplanes sp. NPDC051633 TaxID=3155670 RepID=UPI0034344BED